jgi:hypothetical protein
LLNIFLWSFYHKKGRLRLLGFDAESFHSGQPPLNGLQPAPEIRRLGMQVGFG